MGKSSQVGRILLSAVFVVGLWLAPLYALGLGLFLLALTRLRQRQVRSHSASTQEAAANPRSFIIYSLAGLAFLGALLFFMRSFYNYLDSAPMGSDPLCFLACLTMMAVATSLDRQKPPESDLF